MSKYFAEFGAAIPQSAKLAAGKRNAISPSLSLGWKLSKESFLADSKVVDDLMISASGTILNSDLDIANYYLYTGRYNQTVDWAGWYDGTSERTVISQRAANPDLTYVKRKEFSVNAKASLFKRLITVDASYFANRVQGLVTQPTTLYPNYFAQGNSNFMPYVNFNNNDRSGFDASVNFNKKVGKVDISLGLNVTYYEANASKRDELYQYSYQNRTGKPIDAIWGLKCLGYYTDADIAAINATPANPRPLFSGIVKAGDLKYADVNSDGYVDEKDQVNLGRGGWYGNPVVGGANLTVKYSGFTLFALATAGSGAYAMKNSTYFWVYGEGKYSEVVRGRWTPATAATATFPRLTTQSGSNNFQNSDYWLYKTDRIDIAKVQLTYDFPSKVLKNFVVHDISVYVSGSNLLTIAKEREILELNTTTAPQTRFYNLGLKLTF
jgi:hypothetical protein